MCLIELELVEELFTSAEKKEIINQLKRYLALEESNQPAEWNGMYSNVENNFAPWKFSPDDRDRWAQELQA